MAQLENPPGTSQEHKRCSVIYRSVLCSQHLTGPPEEIKINKLMGPHLPPRSQRSAWRNETGLQEEKFLETRRDGGDNSRQLLGLRYSVPILAPALAAAPSFAGARGGI